MDEAVADMRKLTGSDSGQVGIFLQNLVSYRIEHGELERAQLNADEAMRILGAKAQRESLTFAVTLLSRAQAHLARRDLPAALADFDAAVPLLTKVPGPEGEFTLLARASRAMTLGYLGRLDEARTEIEAVAPLAAKQPNLEALNARIDRTHGTLLRLAGDPRGALAWQEKVLATTSALPKLQRERMRARAELGLSLLALGERERAIAALEQALTEFQKLETQMTPSRAEALAALRTAKGTAPTT
jgi:tetratricopeptide (TPR) repeat protein